MSMYARLNANLEAAIAEQRARYAAEDGRDIEREKCVEAMARALCQAEGVDPETKCYGLGKLIPLGDVWPAYKVRMPFVHAALDAAIASGYVVRPK